MHDEYVVRLFSCFHFFLAIAKTKNQRRNETYVRTQTLSRRITRRKMHQMKNRGKRLIRTLHTLAINLQLMYPLRRWHVIFRGSFCRLRPLLLLLPFTLSKILSIEWMTYTSQHAHSTGWLYQYIQRSRTSTKRFFFLSCISNNTPYILVRISFNIYLFCGFWFSESSVRRK